eukprot:19803-Alexandrium_andersonii.AAC.1
MLGYRRACHGAATCPEEPSGGRFWAAKPARPCRSGACTQVRSHAHEYTTPRLHEGRLCTCCLLYTSDAADDM